LPLAQPQPQQLAGISALEPASSILEGGGGVHILVMKFRGGGEGGLPFPFGNFFPSSVPVPSLVFLRHRTGQSLLLRRGALRAHLFPKSRSPEGRCSGEPAFLSALPVCVGDPVIYSPRSNVGCGGLLSVLWIADAGESPKNRTCSSVVKGRFNTRVGFARGVGVFVDGPRVAPFTHDF
jgi:hypothetical protein